jgi:hypothetical protein
MHWHRVLLAPLLGSLLIAGCGGDTTGPSSSMGPLYWQLQLNHHAITLGRLAPYDTIQLTATPLDPTGAPIVTTARPVYTTSDTSITIDSTGFVRVHWANASDRTNIQVVAQLTIGDGRQGLTLADTAIVNVVNPTGAQPTFDSLVFRPVADDSARRAVIDAAGKKGVKQVFDRPVVKWGAANIPNAIVHYASSDPLIASFTTTNTTAAPTINANAPGVVLLTAEATVYGVRRVDSVWYTVGYPLLLIASYGVGEQFQFDIPTQPRNRLPLGTLTIGQGGVVLWGNSLLNVADDSMDVEFDDPTDVAGLPTTMTFKGLFSIVIPAGSGGNIPAFPATQWTGPDAFNLHYITYDSVSSKARLFPKPGTYHWVGRHQGVEGTVIVVSNDSLRPTLNPSMGGTSP